MRTTSSIKKDSAHTPCIGIEAQVWLELLYVFMRDGYMNKSGGFKNRELL